MVKSLFAEDREARLAAADAPKASAVFFWGNCRLKKSGIDNGEETKGWRRSR
jgi:hypothetical protein